MTNTSRVYILLNPLNPGLFRYEDSDYTYEFDHEPFYVGKDSEKTNRPKRHLAQYGDKNTYCANTIKKIKRNDKEPLIEIMHESLTDKQALKREKKVVLAIGRKATKKGRKGPLTNMTNGGEGVAGHIKSKATLKKISIKSQTWWDSRTKEQLVEIGKQCSVNNYKYWENVSENELLIRSKNLSVGNKRFWASLTKAERLAHRKLLAQNTQAQWDSMNKKQRRAFIAMQNIGKDARTPEQKAYTAKLLSLTGKEFWASLSKKQRKVHIEKITAGVIASRPKAVASYLATIAKMTKKERAEWRSNISYGLLEYHADPANASAIAERGKKISDTAAARTPKQKKKLSKKFRDAQHAMSDGAKRKKNAKVSKGNKEYQANLTDAEKQKISEAGTNAQIKNWSKLNTAQRSTRSQVSADTIRNTPGLRKQTNANIAASIKAKHQSQTPQQKAIRKFNTMVGGLCSNAVRKGNLSVVDMPLVKERLRTRGARFYSLPKNFNVPPTKLRDKCVAQLVA